MNCLTYALSIEPPHDWWMRAFAPGVATRAVSTSLTFGRIAESDSTAAAAAAADDDDDDDAKEDEVGSGEENI